MEYSSCTGLNSITITAEYKKTDTSEWLNKKTIKPGSNVLGGELDTEFSYDVRYVLKDAFSTVTYIDYVSTAIYLMHFLHGGRGVAFGQKATMDKLTQENADLKRSMALSEKKAKLLAMGYDEKLADDTATAMVDGDMDKVMANQTKYLEAREKDILAKKMKGTPRPLSLIHI